MLKFKFKLYPSAPAAEEMKMVWPLSTSPILKRGKKPEIPGIPNAFYKFILFILNFYYVRYLLSFWIIIYS